MFYIVNFTCFLHTCTCGCDASTNLTCTCIIILLFMLILMLCLFIFIGKNLYNNEHVAIKLVGTHVLTMVSHFMMSYVYPLP